MMSLKSDVKWVTEADNYSFQFGDDVQKFVSTELREDEPTRRECLAKIRYWIMQNPKITNCRLDGIFLLRFLRSKKFSITQAQEALERYLLLRSCYSVAFQCLDITIPTMQELIDIGYLFAVPGRDSKNRRVTVARPGVFDPSKYSSGDMLRIHGIVYETLMEDELNQIYGFVHFVDAQGLGFPHLTLFTPKEAVRIVKNGERTLPMRHKEVHVINCHPSVKFAMDFGMNLVSEKIRKRISAYTSLKDAMNKGVDTSMLPKEYGGTMPMRKMTDLFKEELFKHNSLIMSNDLMGVNESLFSEKAREGAVSALKASCSSYGTDLHGIAGTFRKLQVD